MKNRLPFLSSRDMSARPGAVLRRTARDGLTVITVNGKPKAMLMPINDETFMDEIMRYAAARSQAATRREQERAEKDGRSKMTMKQITAEIKAARRERRAKQAARVGV
ncbi:MAG: type II toxin-antitoxin system prevent-host-death family antitoxin [Verrucomicrobiota bacterium]